MSSIRLPITYLFWHYTAAWEDVLRLYLNLSWFLWNFFSIRILLQTLFSPWHRRREHPEKEFGGLLGSLILNSILRMVGFLIRSLTILFGLITLAVFSILYAAFFALWPFLPLLIVGFLVTGAAGLLAF